MQFRNIEKLKLLFLDFDGTIMDSMGMWDQLNRRILEKNSVPVPPGLTEDVTPLNEYETAAYFQALGCRGSVEDIMREVEAMAVEAYTNWIVPKPGAVAFLEAMRARGVRLALLTAALPTRTGPCLKRNQMSGWFSPIITCENYEGGKSNPQIYLDAMQNNGVTPEECLFFDDNLVALQSAGKAGMQTVGVYDAGNDRSWETIQASATYAIRAFTEIEVP